MTTKSTRSPRRRTVVALGVVLAVLSAFVVRLIDIQVVNADQHVQDAVAMSFGDSVTLKGTRGTITDTNGTALAKSRLLYDGQFSPINVKNMYDPDAKTQPEVGWDEMAGRIGAITGQSGDDVKKIVADALADNPESQFAYLKRGLSTQQYRDLAELGLPYLSFTSQPSRIYPDGAVGGNLVGFVGVDGTGLAGLELSEESCLKAIDGTETFERGKDGTVIPGTLVEQPAVDGGTVTLTIDGDLQWYMQQLIAEQVIKQGAHSGTITVVDASTGKIRAAAEYPTVDPNNIDAKGSYLNSRIFINMFEPGSTFKALTAATLVDAAGQKPTSTANVPSKITFPNGAVVRDSFAHPTYDYTLTGVLIDSSNAGIATFSERVKPSVRAEYLKKFGIGQSSDVGFYGEAKGLLYPVEDWDNQQYYDTTYGQGLTTTVPELMGAYGALANDGVRMPLSLVESCTRSDGTVVAPTQAEPVRVVSEKTAKQVTQMLESVYMQGGWAQQVKVPDYRVAMKTGTSQKSNDNGGYKSGAYFTTAIGYAPAEDPQYVIAVTLDEPKRLKSSGANAEAFRKAVTQVMKTYRVMPSTGKAPTLPKFG